MKQPSEVTTTLIKARAIVAQGWCQGGHQVDGGHCVEAAVYHGAGVAIGQEDGTVLAVMDVLRDAVGVSALHVWNDDRSRTQAQVLEAFDKAIERSNQP